MAEFYDDANEVFTPKTRDWNAEMEKASAQWHAMKDEDHWHADAEMEKFMKKQAEEAAAATGSTVAKEVLGDGDKQGAVIVEDEQQFDALKEAHETGLRAVNDDSPPTPSAESLKAAEVDPLAPAKTPRPTSMEMSLAQVQLSTQRQQRLVILGDPMVERRFYDKLAAKGKLTYDGNTPIIGISRKDSIKLLDEISREMGGHSRHAAQMKFDRDEGGLLSKVVNPISNLLGRTHQLDVVVVGSPAILEEKLKEVGAFVEKLHESSLVSLSKEEKLEAQEARAREVAENKADVTPDGKLRLNPSDLSSPLQLTAGKNLYVAISLAKDAVQAYGLEGMKADQARRDFRNEQNDKEIQKARDKESGLVGLDAESKVVAENSYARGVADKVGRVKDEATLKEEGGAKTVLTAFTRLQDPDKKEFGTLPAPDRHDTLVKLSAMALKMDEGQFGSKAKGSFDKVKVEGVTSRDRLASIVAHEKETAPSFERNVRDAVQRLVANGELSDSQGDTVLAKLGVQKEAQVASEATQKETPQAPAADTQQAPTQTPAEKPEVAKEAAPADAKPEVATAAQKELPLGEADNSVTEKVAPTVDAPASPAEVAKDAPAPVAEAKPEVAVDAAAPAPSVEPEKVSDSVKPEQQKPGVSREAMAATARAAMHLSATMANPAGSFTNRDKSWNEMNVQRAAADVLKLDTGAVSELNAGERTKLAAYSAWIADNAVQQKLPGFDTAQGKELAAKLHTKALELVGKAGGSMPKDAARSLAKADRMVSAIEQRASAHLRTAPRDTVRTSPGTPPSTRNQANDYAKDVVQAVYQKEEISESYLKYLLKNADRLTPESMKGLDERTKARATVGLNALVDAVKEQGILGDYKTLSSSVKQQVENAGKTASSLFTAFSKQGNMDKEIGDAYFALSADKGKSDKTAAKETGGASQQTTEKGVSKESSQGRER